MSMAVKFAYKHQRYMHDSAISTHSLGPSAMTCIGYKQLVCERSCQATSR